MGDRRRFEGRSVFITGAGSGIGEATAHAFAEEGAKVAIAELAPARGEAVRDAIRAKGGTAFFTRRRTKFTTAPLGNPRRSPTAWFSTGSCCSPA